MTDDSPYDRFFRDAPELFVLLRPNRRIEVANPAFRAHVRQGRDGVDFMDLVAPEAGDRVLQLLVRAAGGDEVLISVPHPVEDGNRIVDYRFFPVEGGLVAGIGRVAGETPLAALGRAQAELQEKTRILDEIQLELTQVPFIDPVTGVWNRLQVIERLTSEWSRSERYGTPISCLFVEVEALEDVRRRQGAMVGDEILKAVARRIKGVVRDHDILGRYGGDRFVAIAVHADSDGARALSRRIEHALKEPVTAGGRTEPVRVRIGAATNRSEGVEILEDLFAVAGTALEDARSSNVSIHVAEDS